MAKPWKTDLFATAEDDIRQFGAALFGLFRAAPRAMANILEHLADIEDFALAMATYRAACERWPGANITLRAGATVIEDTRRVRTATVKYPLA